jgi:DNA helicase-2/ATP-dependent DNA helicase PcrA
MLSYLRLIANPNSDTDFLRVVNVPARGIGQRTVIKLMDLAAENATCLTDTLENALADQSLSGAAAKKLKGFFALMQQLKKAREELSPSELLERVLEESGYRAVLEKDDTAESDARLQNVAELVGSLREYESEAPDTGEEISLEGYLERVSLVAAVDTLKDTPTVSLMTVHAAKGLEFEQVWITGMEEETFPFRGLDGEDPEELDEERRLAYVAITRARKKLTVSHASTRFLFGRTKYLGPSRFIDDIPADCREMSGQARPALPGWDGYAPAGRTRETSPGYASSDGWGATRARSGRPSYEETSPGGRRASARLELPKGRHLDRDAFDDLPPDEFGQESYDEGETVVVLPGQRVRHKKFGRGIVERVESGDKPTVVARFSGYGPKRILAEYLDFETN